MNHEVLHFLSLIEPVNERDRRTIELAKQTIYRQQKKINAQAETITGLMKANKRLKESL